MTASEGQELLHEERFPGESDEYRRAREQLLRAESSCAGRPRLWPHFGGSCRLGASSRLTTSSQTGTLARVLRGRFGSPSCSRTARTRCS